MGVKIVEKSIRHKNVCKMIHKVYLQKNEEYGDSFGELYDELGDMSALVQVLHKVNRAKQIVQNGGDLEDTVLDLANYAIMWYMEIGGKHDN